MRKSALALAAVAVMLVMTACGGGGGAGPPANRAPTANAGAAQTVLAGAAVLLNGTASSDSDGIVAGYAWTQTSGTGVTLNNSTSARPGFVAPSVVAAATLTFSLVVTDNSGAASTASSVTITVNPPPAGNVTVSGVVRFERVPFFNSGTFGLNYASPVLQPARGVIVRALNPALEILATGVTSATGAYSLSVAGNTSITIQVVARMQRDVSLPLPRWDVRVQNGPDFPVPYSHTTTAFNSSLGTQNIDIPTGIGPTGTAIPGSVRASGPFAILDTIYRAMQTVLVAEPAANFPTLLVDWGSQSECTCFTISGGQSIALMSDLTEDTDEFDQHVVAHEFGHYIEHNFSRSDSIGGSHGLGDRLDMRVAFGEGFGYAFAGMVLNDPFARDSYFDGAHVAGGFIMDFNPPGDGSGPGCWCSESSVWSILWDIYDGVGGEPSGNVDNVALGFEPIWDVLTGPQRSTNSLTSIFSFIHALKAAQPAFAAAIDSLVAAQNIVSATINPFASNETNEPFPNMLPIYATITLGVPVVLRTIDDAGRYNKVGNRRFLRFVPAISGNVTLSVRTSNPNVGADPDFIVFREGAFFGISENPPPQPETVTFPVTAGLTYIFDVYDCANGCPPEPVQGIAGDYDLTVTIN